MRIFILIALGILILLLLLLFIWILISSGKIKKLKGSNSITEKYTYTINGAKNGFIIRGYDKNNPVLLLVSSGPGSPDYFLTEKYKDMDLEKYYTIVYWEYRGCAIAYDKKIDPQTLTTDLLVEDTKEVTKYLINKFNKDKIYIMGFSGGSYIALNTISKYPELYHAYFGMAQVVSHDSDNDTLIYNKLKEVFENKKQNSKLKSLEKNVEHLDNDKVKITNWDVVINLVHDAGLGTIKDKSETKSITIPLILSSCYTIKEKINYIKGLKLYKRSTLHKENLNTDFRKSLTHFEVPIYFISGEYDYNTPWPLVEEYYNLIDAPKKGFYLVKDSAHSPLWENSKDTVSVLKDLMEDN